MTEFQQSAVEGPGTIALYICYAIILYIYVMPFFLHNPRKISVVQYLKTLEKALLRRLKVNMFINVFICLMY